tara:strand:- start:14 stop:364 length:351 start_codon:yes stop_codon:yes gene_type:complete
MTKLTTHVLDIFSGKPGKGIVVELFFFDKDEKKMIKKTTLNDDGRSNDAIIEKETFKVGKYELVFYVGDYFKKITNQNNLQFLDDVVVRFKISNNKESYHIPLIVSPWSYSTYRGS